MNGLYFILNEGSSGFWHNDRKPASAELSLNTSSLTHCESKQQRHGEAKQHVSVRFTRQLCVNASLLWASNITPAWKQVWNREENLKYKVKITRLSGELLYSEATSCCSGWAHLRLHWSVNASLPEETFGGCRAPRWTHLCFYCFIFPHTNTTVSVLHSSSLCYQVALRSSAFGKSNPDVKK